MSVDELPFGTYVEIEGTKEGIREVIEKLGFDPKRAITEAYFEIYREICEREGKEMGNLVFWRKS